MQNEEIINTINRLLITEIEIDEDQIKPTADLKNDLGIDSLDFVDLFVIIENNFGFKIRTEDLVDMKTLQDFYHYIIKRVNKN